MADSGDGTTGFAERLIDATEWSDFRLVQGEPASRVGEMLSVLLLADRRTAAAAGDDLENVVVPQANLHSVAEPVVSILAAALVDPRPRWVQVAILDLLFLILTGAPVADEVERGNGDLLERCTARVRESLDTLVQVALTDPICSRAVLDVLELVDPGGPASAVVRARSK